MRSLLLQSLLAAAAVQGASGLRWLPLRNDRQPGLSPLPSFRPFPTRNYAAQTTSVGQVGQCSHAACPERGTALAGASSATRRLAGEACGILSPPRARGGLAKARGARQEGALGALEYVVEHPGADTNFGLAESGRAEVPEADSEPLLTETNAHFFPGRPWLGAQGPQPPSIIEALSMLLVGLIFVPLMASPIAVAASLADLIAAARIR